MKSIVFQLLQITDLYLRGHSNFPRTKVDISNAKTRERKLKVLEAAEELKCENLLLITWGTDDMAEYKGHTIKIVSVRNWFYACKLPYILNIPVVTSQKATDTPHPDRWLFIPCSDSVSSARHRTPHCRSRWQS